MKTIVLPAGCEFISFDGHQGLGWHIAEAEFPDQSLLDARMRHDWRIGGSLLNAVRQGRLRVRDCQTRFALKPDAPSVDVLPSLVSVNDFREFVAELGYAVQVGDLSEESVSQDVPASSERSLAPATEAEPDVIGVGWLALDEHACNAHAWIVIKPQRDREYSMPLYRLLLVAHREGKPRPTARQVVDAWRMDMPPEIAKMLPDGFDYYDAKGNTKTAELEGIRKRIGRMTSARYN